MDCFIQGISVGFFCIICDILSLSYLNLVGIVEICFRWLRLVIGFKSFNLEHPWFMWTSFVSVFGFILYPSMSKPLTVDCIMTIVMVYPLIHQLEGMHPAECMPTYLVGIGYYIMRMSWMIGLCNFAESGPHLHWYGHKWGACYV